MIPLQGSNLPKARRICKAKGACISPKHLEPSPRGSHWWGLGVSNVAAPPPQEGDYLTVVVVSAAFSRVQRSLKYLVIRLITIFIGLIMYLMSEEKDVDDVFAER